MGLRVSARGLAPQSKDLEPEECTGKGGEGPVVLKGSDASFHQLPCSVLQTWFSLVIPRISRGTPNAYCLQVWNPNYIPELKSRL